MNGRATAATLWGPEAVARALAESTPEAPSVGLAAEVERRADPPGGFRAWALAQPWPRFCAVVRIVTGTTAAELRREERGEGMPKAPMLSFRVDPGELQRLETLAKRFPLLSRSALAREALRYGLEAFEREGLAVLDRIAPPGPPAADAPQAGDDDEPEPAPNAWVWWPAYQGGGGMRKSHRLHTDSARTLCGGFESPAGPSAWEPAPGLPRCRNCERAAAKRDGADK